MGPRACLPARSRPLLPVLPRSTSPVPASAGAACFRLSFPLLPRCPPARRRVLCVLSDCGAGVACVFAKAMPFGVPADVPETKRPDTQASDLVFCTGGGGGIRTLVTRVTGKTVFETAAFNHSATPPHGMWPQGFLQRPWTSLGSCPANRFRNRSKGLGNRALY